MTLNFDLIGRKMELEPVEFAYDFDKVILYALGIGASPEDELDFVYEKSGKILPTFAALPTSSIFLDSFAPAANLNMHQVLHVSQQIIFHEPIPASAVLKTTLLWESVHDKGDNGAVINLVYETIDSTGKVIFENRVAIMDRSAGNFGGERGPKTEIFAPPEGAAPDFCVEYTTSRGQAALYRLSGDKNPLHIDPDFAKKGGFDRPILHGLCTMGFAGRAVLHNSCGSDPERLKSIYVRFMNVAFPGDALMTSGWNMDDGRILFETKNQDGKIVLGNGIARIN